MSVNKVILLGELKTEPELKYTAGSSAVCNFTLVTEEKWLNKEKKEQVKKDFHRVVVWGKQAELCNSYLNAGSQAYVEGRLQTRSWEDKTGNKRYITEVNASDVKFLGAKAATNNEVDSRTHAQNMFNTDLKVETKDSFTADEIPF